MIRKILVTLTGLAALTAVGMSPASASTAQAVSPLFSTEICAQAGTGYCLNDWSDGGSGAAVKMYTSGTANDYFETVGLTAYHYGGYEGYEIVPNGHQTLCVGTDASANANLGACPNPHGGSTGSNIWIENGACDVGSLTGTLLVNIYWSNKYGTNAFLVSGGSVGAQAKITTSLAGASCWAQI
ncbi:MAG TPA: hypothetical protein VGM53_35190 [Streptosporangiaceae bacterium]|jgi:hypothetical protein